MGISLSFDATVWEHDGLGGWYFISVPQRQADEITEHAESQASGFGSVRVEATIGGTTWQTSLFPDSKRATYVLPVKKAVRTAEALTDGSSTTVNLVVLSTSTR